MSQEIELKLALPREALPELLAHPLIANAPGVGGDHVLLNTYFDTPGLELRSRRIAVRLRKEGERWLQTVKCAAASLGGLASRPEWEQPYPGDRFDFSQIDVPQVRDELEGFRSRLAPVFTTTFQRVTRRLEPAPGIVILAMIDDGTIEAGGRTMPLCELELELVSGDPGELYALATQLAADVPLCPEDASKAQRGYELYQNLKPAPRRARALVLDAELDAVDAFRQIAYETLAMWQANEALAARLDDPEFIHQARVALRRMRTLFALFRRALPKSMVKEWRPRLAELASGLGGARNADVVLQDLLLPITRDGRAGEDIHRLIAAVEARRNAERESLRSGKAWAGRGRAQLDLAAALHALDTTSGVPLHTLAHDAMQRVRRDARDCLSAAEAGDVAQLHRLRIVLKRLRYGLDFFSSLWLQDRVYAYSRALADLQECLGAINDAAMANVLLADVAAGDPGLAAARAFAAGWHAPRIALLRARALVDAEALLSSRAPWKQKGKRE
ncbi:inorganic triphosphatase [Niveibacterium umoris]|uniref:Adenylate cyclase n=1 Tax=Niveibacterium umoris TaxID=1193620 RepID=A0A840BFW8_9RHOO|nr:CYTH and CHAD domain-containing protein [Niveibacterium umoris]MBB4012431.1 adenylate cyclase [Niveibacterium umoris]